MQIFSAQSLQIIKFKCLFQEAGLLSWINPWTDVKNFGGFYSYRTCFHINLSINCFLLVSFQMKRTEAWRQHQWPKQAFIMHKETQVNSFWHSIKTTGWKTAFISVFCSCVLIFSNTEVQTWVKNKILTDAFCGAVYTLVATVYVGFLFTGIRTCKHVMAAYSQMNFRDISPSLSWRSWSTLSLWAAVKMFFQSPILPVMKKQTRPDICWHFFGTWATVILPYLCAWSLPSPSSLAETRSWLLSLSSWSWM